MSRSDSTDQSIAHTQATLQENGANEEWYEGDEAYAQDVEPFCSILYQYAGKCNQHLTDAQGFKYSNAYLYNQNGGVDDDLLGMYLSINQYLNEDAVCAYIDSLRMNTYDENGQVLLGGEGAWNPSEWRNSIRIQKRAMSAGMKAGLTITALLAFGMAVAACVLHGMLARKNIPWLPSKKTVDEDPTDLARQNSGIVMGRSRSGPGTTPLI